jgi:predicted alpha/beta hydrolase family esterase
MPEKKFADYEAWKIYFEKIIPYLQEDCIIATTSLGSTFIVKYLQENNLDVSIKKLFLIAPAIEDTPTEVL